MPGTQVTYSEDQLRSDSSRVTSPSLLQLKMAHILSGDAKAILLALTLLAVVQTARAKDIVVGGATQKWDFPPGTDSTYYDTWTAAQSFAVGDRLVFQYLAGGHDVQLVSEAEYAGCMESSTNDKLRTGFDEVSLPEAGDYYFLCTFPTHCDSGMKLQVTVAPTPLAVPPTVPSPDFVLAPSLPPAATIVDPPPPPATILDPPPPPGTVLDSPPPPGTVLDSPPPPATFFDTPPPPVTSVDPPAAVPLPPGVLLPPAGLPPPLAPSPSVKTPAPSSVAKAPVSGTGRKSSPIGLIGGSIAGSVGIAALVLGILILRCRRRGSHLGTLEPNKSSGLELLDTTSRPFTYRELSSCTKNFSDSELLSSGGFGEVFKGTLPSGAFIAVKRIKRNKMQGEESFLAEATSLGQIRHRNLLRLRGWCQAKEGLLLVYDFMCNGSLDQWIYRPSSEGSNGDKYPSLDHVNPGLSWNRRLWILAGTASGLVYLHEEWQQCILHRDIKASNVLLDASFNAYLGDFGLARLVDHGVMQKTTLLAGTLGYMAPEMQYTGRASIETDVYAFGILVLEVVCGRPALGSVAIGDSTEHYVLVESVWQAHEAGHILRAADPRLWNGNSGDALDETRVGKVLQLGLLCCLPSPTERPSMRFVSQWFQSGAGQELPWFPDRKPSLNLPTPSRIDSSLGQDKLPAGYVL